MEQLKGKKTRTSENKGKTLKNSFIVIILFKLIVWFIKCMGYS